MWEQDPIHDAMITSLRWHKNCPKLMSIWSYLLLPLNIIRRQFYVHIFRKYAGRIFLKRNLKCLIFTYSTPHKEEPRKDVQVFDNCWFLFFDSILGGYDGRFVLDRDGARVDTIVIQKYDDNFGPVLGKTGYGVRGREWCYRVRWWQGKGGFWGHLAIAAQIRTGS